MTVYDLIGCMTSDFVTTHDIAIVNGLNRKECIEIKYNQEDSYLYSDKDPNDYMQREVLFIDGSTKGKMLIIVR